MSFPSGINPFGRIRKQVNLPTLLGLIAVLFWSTSVAFSRSVTEKIGTFNTAFFNMMCSGLCLLLAQALIYKKKLIYKIAKLPFAYLYKVGTFLVLYMVLFYIAVGEAGSREAVIVIGIINYLWPGLTFLFSVPILKNKAKYSLLISGILAALAGTTTALLEGSRLSMSQLKSTLKGDILPFLLALGAAVSWGIYSNMTRKHKFKEDISALPLLLFSAGFVILILQLVKGETPVLDLSGREYIEFAYLFIFPTALAYLFWDRAMKGGSKDLVVAFSYGIPLVSTLISCYYLKITVGFGFLFAAVLVIIGAVLCRRSIKEERV